MEWGNVFMISLIKEYGGTIMAVVGAIMFFAVLLYVIYYFDDFSSEFIKSLTGSGKSV